MKNTTNTETPASAAVRPAKEWANPTPAGLASLALVCVCFFALLTGRVGSGALPLLGCWMIGGFVVQVIVALLDLKGGNSAGGNVFLLFSAFFMLVGGLEMFVKFGAGIAGIPLDARIDGWAWVVLTLVIWLWSPAFFQKFNLLSIVVILIDIALPIIALTDLDILAKSWGHVAGWSLLAAGAVAVYLCAAMVVNAAAGKKIYPVL